MPLEDVVCWDHQLWRGWHCHPVVNTPAKNFDVFYCSRLQRSAVQAAQLAAPLQRPTNVLPWLVVCLLCCGYVVSVWLRLCLWYVFAASLVSLCCVFAASLMRLRCVFVVLWLCCVCLVACYVFGMSLMRLHCVLSVTTLMTGMSLVL